MSAARPTIRLIGLPTDSHSSFLRGSAAGPPLIRAALRSDHANMAAESGVELDADVTVEDAGELALDEGAADFDRIRDAATQAARDEVVPIFIGGDHMVTNPIVAGLVAVHGPVNILHFDAHPDLYADFEGDPLSHASPFARIMERGDAQRLVQVGIRTLNAHCRAQVAVYGVEVVEMRDFAPDRVPVPHAPLYISIDLDALDPAFAPGVAHHEPGGLSVRDILSVLHRVRVPIIGADVVEYHPQRDIHGMTATVAAKLVKELAALSVPRA
ncbi:agmatinase family protein [Sphingomonas lutea]|uniref:Agmatinase family protein n=1 Tax=Sphingomonas lutea TaxID=1045317 RepID=A0A7G9SF66_9SPHN|nr:agmatinase family protein [Sphingomonas lutea]QNN66491.1 agmatinase family protein [Sphingomonas lutea]